MAKSLSDLERIHEMPVLRKWRIFERDDFGAEGARRRDELAVYIKRMDAEAAKFGESKARYLEREARRSERAKA